MFESSFDWKKINKCRNNFGDGVQTLLILCNFDNVPFDQSVK